LGKAAAGKSNRQPLRETIIANSIKSADLAAEFELEIPNTKETMSVEQKKVIEPTRGIHDMQHGWRERWRQKSPTSQSLGSTPFLRPLNVALFLA
jgi:hypothetical protein